MSNLIPKRYAVIVMCVIAVLGALGQAGIVPASVATGIATVLGGLVAEAAHRASPPDA